jgi:hypothetical protein
MPARSRKNPLNNLEEMGGGGGSSPIGGGGGLPPKFKPPAWLQTNLAGKNPVQSFNKPTSGPGSQGGAVRVPTINIPYGSQTVANPPVIKPPVAPASAVVPPVVPSTGGFMKGAKIFGGAAAVGAAGGGIALGAGSLFDDAEGIYNNSSLTNIPVNQLSLTAGGNELTIEADGGGGGGAGEVDDNEDYNAAAEAAFQDRLAKILEQIENQKVTTGQTYSDMYSQLRDQTTFQASLTNPNQVTGGMAEQQRARLSAAETAAFSQIGSQRESAIRELDMMSLNAESMARMQEQEEFAMMADRQNQFVGLANNYFQLAEEAAAAGNLEQEQQFREQADYYNSLAGQVGGELGTLAGGPAPQPREPGLKIPEIDVAANIGGQLGVTAEGKTAVNSLAKTLNQVAQSGGTAFGLTSAEIRNDADLLTRGSAKLASGTDDTLRLVQLTDGDLIGLIQDWEKQTGQSVLQLDVSETVAASLAVGLPAMVAGAKSGAVLGGIGGSVVPGVGNVVGATGGGIVGGIGAAGGTIYNAQIYKISRTDLSKILGNTTLKYQTLQAAG